MSCKSILSPGFFVLIVLLSAEALAVERFVDHGDGTVTDTETSLMWAAVDNGKPINWPDALSYCQQYSGGGHVDWRLPTLDELASLYDHREKNKNGYHINKAIDTSASSCWALETQNAKAARFNFTYGKVYWLRRFYSGPTRVLPVRGGKK